MRNKLKIKLHIILIKIVKREENFTYVFNLIENINYGYNEMKWNTWKKNLSNRMILLR